MDAWNAAHAPRIVRPAPSRSPPESAAHHISSRPGSRGKKPQVVVAIKAGRWSLAIGCWSPLSVAGCALQVARRKSDKSEIPNPLIPHSQFRTQNPLSSDISHPTTGSMPPLHSPPYCPLWVQLFRSQAALYRANAQLVLPGEDG